MKIKIILFSFFVFLFFVPKAHAAGEFTTKFLTTYNVGLDGNAIVNQEITLTNNFSTIYASSYDLILEGKKPVNVVANESGKSLPVKQIIQDNKTDLKIDFPDAVVGKDKNRIFTVSYTLPAVGVQNGRVWELTIPRIVDESQISAYNLTLVVAKALGQLAYISPEPIEKSTNDNQYIFQFDKESIAKAGIVAALGDFQVYSIGLKYHLENPYKNLGETQIALPPDTAFQRVYYKIIDPKPEKIELDNDGNWLATFLLQANQNIQVNVDLDVQLFSKPQFFYPKTTLNTKPYYLESSAFWQTQNKEITTISAMIKTPQEIYNYVVNRLSYDYSKVASGKAVRLGAVKALENPQNAICTEFTDLFIALSRASGIPAREIEGYAYAKNPSLQPLSLVTDVLHAWPEYWDANLGIWKPADPTWGKTTGGVDYFNKFDLSHITFVIHGEDPNLPPPPGAYKIDNNPQKDVQVSFGKLPDKRDSSPEIEVSSPKFSFPFLPSSLTLTIKNNGPVALYDIPISFFGQETDIKTSPQQINFLAPFDRKTINLKFTLPFWGFGRKSTIAIYAGETTETFTIPKNRMELMGLAVVFFTLLAFMVLVILIIKLVIKKQAVPVSGKK